MGCLSSVNLKEGKVETTSFLTVVLWPPIVKLPNPAAPTAGHSCVAKTASMRYILSVSSAHRKLSEPATN